MISGEGEQVVATSSHARTDTVRQLVKLAEPGLDDLADRLVARVSGDIGRDGPSEYWQTAAAGWVGDFLDCLVADDGERILAPGSTFEEAGVQAAREGVDVETLMTGIRVANRLTQAQVHRAVLKARVEDEELTLELLDRVLFMGELVVTAAKRGHDLAVDETTDDEVLAQRLVAELLRGGDAAPQIAARLGWAATDLAIAVVATPRAAVAIREEGARPQAWLRREHDIVLALPVGSATMATTLRSRLERHHVAVGPAVPLAEFPDSVDLAERIVDREAEEGEAVFADDRLLEMVTGRDVRALRALRRKHLTAIDELPGDARTELLATLREWLLRWGHRPSIARALYVHPQTVSARISRLKELLTEDLEDPRVRSELLVLLLADAQI